MSSIFLPPPEILKAKVRSQMIHVMLTVLMAFVVIGLTHRPYVAVMMFASAWMGSIFMFVGGPLPLWRILAAVAFNGVIFYLLARFVLPG